MLAEAVEEVNFTQLKLKKAENNDQKVYEKLKDKKVLPISDMEGAQFILYLQTEMGFAGKGKLGSEFSVEARGELVRFAALHQLPLVTESHGSTGGPAHSNDEEEEETPTATPIKTVSCIRLGKHKGKLKQNVTVSH